MATAQILSAAILYTGSAYEQSFDGTIRSTGNSTNDFPPSGSATPITAGPAGSSGWVGAKIGGSNTTGNMPYFVDDGDANSGAIYSYGSTDNVELPTDFERALGLVASGTHIGGFGVELVNNTGANRHKVDISFISEYWRSSTTAQNTLTFGYSIGAPNDAAFITVAGTPFAALDVVGPAPVGANGALNGNLAINQDPQSGTLNVNWPVGQSLYLRWRDVNDGGNDAGLAIDNFVLTIPEPASAALMLLAAVGMLGCRRSTVR